MARYKKTGFMDDDAGSVSSIQLNEGVRSGGTHIRYHMVSKPSSIFQTFQWIFLRVSSSIQKHIAENIWAFLRLYRSHNAEVLGWVINNNWTCMAHQASRDSNECHHYIR